MNGVPKTACAVMYRNKCAASVLNILKMAPVPATVSLKHINKKMITVLRVLPPRFKDTLPRIELESSCGNAEFDSFAMQRARRYFSGTNAEGNYGEMIFFWHEILSENSASEVKK